MSHDAATLLKLLFCADLFPPAITAELRMPETPKMWCFPGHVRVFQLLLDAILALFCSFWV